MLSAFPLARAVVRDADAVARLGHAAGHPYVHVADADHADGTLLRCHQELPLPGSHSGLTCLTIGPADNTITFTHRVPARQGASGAFTGIGRRGGAGTSIAVIV
jgi:hypothetical protein